MKIIVSGDWHLDWSTAGLPRFDDGRAAVEVVLEAARREGAELFVFLGDLTNPESVRAHRAVGVAVDVATRLWFGAGIASRWLVGNHDVIEDGSGCSSLEPLRALAEALPRGRESSDQGIKVYDRPTVETFRGKRLLALPFTPRSHAYDPTTVALEVWSNSRDQVAAVFGHLNVEGLEPGSEVADMPRGREVVLPVSKLDSYWPTARVFNGHYHRRQLFGRVHVPGSLQRLTFGEEQNSPGYLIAEV